MNSFTKIKKENPSSRQLPNPSQGLSIQAKPASSAGRLTIGQPDDKYEQEADHIADKVVSMPKPTSVHRKCADCEKEDEVDRKPLAESITPWVQKQTDEEKEDLSPLQTKRFSPEKNTASTSLESRLNNSKSGGSSLPGNTRSFMENSIGEDFSNVKIHTDSNAVQMSQELGAQAFAHGNHVYFNQGKYNPESIEGKHLLAHELVHVGQQYRNIQNKIVHLYSKRPARRLTLREAASNTYKILDLWYEKAERYIDLNRAWLSQNWYAFIALTIDPFIPGMSTEYLKNVTAEAFSGMTVGKAEDWVLSKLAKKATYFGTRLARFVPIIGWFLSAAVENIFSNWLPNDEKKRKAIIGVLIGSGVAGLSNKLTKEAINAKNKLYAAKLSWQSDDIDKAKNKDELASIEKHIWNEMDIQSKAPDPKNLNLYTILIRNWILSRAADWNEATEGTDQKQWEAVIEVAKRPEQFAKYRAKHDLGPLPRVLTTKGKHLKYQPDLFIYQTRTHWKQLGFLESAVQKTTEAMFEDVGRITSGFEDNGWAGTAVHQKYNSYIFESPVSSGKLRCTLILGAKYGTVWVKEWNYGLIRRNGKESFLSYSPGDAHPFLF